MGLDHRDLLSLKSQVTQILTHSCSPVLLSTFNGVYVCLKKTSVVFNSLQPHGLCLPGSSVHGFSRQEYWSGLPCPPPGDLPNPGIKPRSPALQADSLSSEPPGMVGMYIMMSYRNCSSRKQLFSPTNMAALNTTLRWMSQQ